MSNTNVMFIHVLDKNNTKSQLFWLQITNILEKTNGSFAIKQNWNSETKKMLKLWNQVPTSEKQIVIISDKCVL